jgi:MATE family multidrug resistance protein
MMVEESKPGELPWEQKPARALLALAWPTVLSTLSYSVMTLVDTLLVGHLGAASLAGVGLGGTVAFGLLCFVFGLMRGAKTLVSQAIGAGRREEVSAHRGAALFFALGFALLAILVGQLIASFLPLLTSTEEAGQAAAEYLQIRNLGAPFILLFVALRETRYAQGDSRSPMRASLLANVVNIGLAYTFLHGFGWGVAGAAWATVLAHLVEFGVLAWVQAGDGFGPWTTKAKHLRALWSIGLPTGLQFFLEVGSFLLLATMLAAMPETQMAAHQIAIQVYHFAFLPTVAVAEAAAVLVGQSIGAGREGLVLRISLLALRICAAYGIFCVAVLLLGAEALARGFTDDPAVITVAVHLFYTAALFQLADGANIVARATLRGTGDAKVPAMLGVLTAWALTPPLTWLLGVKLGMGALGGWIGLCAECVLGAGVLWWRLWRCGWREASRKARFSVVH